LRSWKNQLYFFAPQKEGVKETTSDAIESVNPLIFCHTEDSSYAEQKGKRRFELEMACLESL